MLTEIHIKNLVTIQECHIDFQAGTTVLTGETGTGKSILLDAIELALGERASEQFVRAGQEKADISLCFDIQHLPEAKAWLHQHELDSHECIIRRTISKDGRSRSFINNMPITLQPLREFGDFLLNLHGQHEHQSLLQADKQRALLDRYAGHQHLVDQVFDLAEQYRKANAELHSLRKLSQERQQRGEFLSFQFQELAELQLTPDEFNILDLEHKQLAHADELLQNLQLVLHALSSHDEQDATVILHRMMQTLENLQHIDPKISSWIENIKSVLIQLHETEEDIQRYLNKTELDPERLAWVEQRISTLFNLARKHKISPQELFDYQQKLKNELQQLENSDERVSQLSVLISEIEKKYQHCAKLLSESRIRSSKKLAKEITAIIHDLALPHAEFQIYFDYENQGAYSSNGLEKIIFQIKTNAGQNMQPLAKTASGGELSRISLAIHIATAEKQAKPTLIFDEVDVGISGSTAEKVGHLLRRLGKTHQVLCVTHLAQVAALGHHHLRVEKTVLNNTTYSTITALSSEEKIQEIARMLGGVSITQKTLAHAKEMLETSLELLG